MNRSETSPSDDVPPQGAQSAVSAALAEAYTLERELGRGGMATVYLAYDRRHGRRVAVKVLAPELRASVSAERFLREIRVTARLTHPHILPLHQSGDVGGLLYYIMPFVEGESLRERLAREPLAPAVALRLIREVASALDYAHRNGVVHRDIKPENVLLEDGHAVVADFGIARAVSRAQEHDAADSAGTATLSTLVGVAMGTPAYMAPEQAAADPEVDYRADLYAWGLIAYEVLAGAHPFAEKQTARAMAAAHLVEAPPDLAPRAPAVPSAVVDLVQRCLAKDPADRPGSAAVLVAVLDGAISSVAARGFAAPRATETVAPRPSVAVLPFANTSGRPTDEHFSDGLTDELIGALSKVAELKVAGRTSVFALKGKGYGVRAVADALGVATVLEGSVRRGGERLKVTAQLVNADDESVLWADAYDRELRDVFAVQEEIAQAIVGALRVKLVGPSARALVRGPTADPVAYELCSKGHYIWNTRLDRDGILQAARYFEQAVARDPSYARAYAGLSDAHARLAVLGYARPHDEFAKAKAAARRALALDDTLAEAHTSLGHALFVYDYERAAAETEFRRAIALDQGYSFARFAFAICLQDQGRFDEAIAQLNAALVTDPLSPMVRNVLGRVYVNARQPERAIRILNEALELNPMLDLSYQQLGHAYLQVGMYTEAIVALRRAASLSGPRDLAHLAYAYAVAGQRGDALSALRQVLESSAQHDLLAFHIAMAHAGLGDTDAAFGWLERGYAERASFMDGLKITPAFDALHGDPRWGQLLRRMRFET